jgi:peroxiredoxin
MQRKYDKDGLVAVSVSLDDPADKGAPERILHFLKSKDAEFTNLRLDEPLEQWQDQLNIALPPVVFVFDRDGRIAGKFEGQKQVDYEKVIEPLVQNLLKK